MDISGTLLYINQAGLEMLKLREEYIGKRIGELGEILPANIWQREVRKREIFFRRDDFETNLLISTEIKQEKIIVFLEEETRENMRRLMRSSDNACEVGQMAGLASDLKAKCLQLAQTNISVLIQGESGTGKEILAQGMHLSSKRKNGPFIVVDCSAIPASLMEAELFGYEPGSFTGARREGRAGRFELADGGTIFLDEIGDLPPDLQPKLLRVLNDHQVTRIGGRKPKKVDIRVIASTNRDLAEMMSEGKFRNDLYYRLMGAEIVLPPLSGRMGHFDELLDLFIAKHGNGREITLCQQAREMMKKYSWPGNIRELEKCVELLTATKPGGEIMPHDLPSGVLHTALEAQKLSLKQILALHEKAVIMQALENNGSNITRTAKELKVSRRCLQKKMAGWKDKPCKKDKM